MPLVEPGQATAHANVTSPAGPRQRCSAPRSPAGAGTLEDELRAASRSVRCAVVAGHRAVLPQKTDPALALSHPVLQPTSAGGPTGLTCSCRGPAYRLDGRFLPSWKKRGKSPLPVRLRLRSNLREDAMPLESTRPWTNPGRVAAPNRPQASRRHADNCPGANERALGPSGFSFREHHFHRDLGRTMPRMSRYPYGRRHRGHPAVRQ